ncbi:hypothetical protein EOD41_13955 [Mucilaginibacter limnophilus]|uniref:Nuclear transport factor 2 family protein n=1 Tax=Mucilaginibacter limnophilus TaxID=1932778 RepID=A0A437MQZ5_9SPHI|nr:nuclear transport factor 2 family protein [Mucilaginibacter limnophilus]RVU00060.1 hypothetical protein EOD41_13955 [Mucilaginibacter limnophilus]
MKTLRTIIPVIALILSLTTASAATRNNDDRLTKNYAISTYVDAIANGKIEGLAEVIDNNTKFCIMQGKVMLSYSKTEMMSFLASLKNIKQSCSVTTTVVEDNSEVAVVKVDMAYENFVRSNYVTVARTADGWKITNVCSVFK